MKKIIIYLFLIFVSISSIAQPIPQQDYMNQTKYWFYRNRLVNEFCKVGPNQGESIPFQSINYNTKFANTGDGGIQKLGHYIAVLATELKMLKNSGQSTTKTIEELFYALYAAKRLDETAENFDFCYDINKENTNVPNPYPAYSTCKNGTGSWNGFMLRDDKNPKPGPLLNYFTNMTGVTNISCGFGQNIPPYTPQTFGAPVSTYASTNNDPSHDQYLNLFIGLRLAQAMLDGTESYTYLNTAYSLKYSLVIPIADKVATFMSAGSLNGPTNVNCQYLQNFESLNVTTIKWWETALYGLAGHSLTCSPLGPYFKPSSNGSTYTPWLFQNPVLKQPSSIENPAGASFPFVMSPGYSAVAGIITEKNAVSTAIAYPVTASAKLIWNDIPHMTFKQIYKWNDNWKILSLEAMTDMWNSASTCPPTIMVMCSPPKICMIVNPNPFSKNHCLVYLPVPPITPGSLLCPLLTNSSLCKTPQYVLYDQAMKAGYEVLPLMYNVLFNKTGFDCSFGSNAYTDFFNNHINLAPCRGPYCNSATDRSGYDWSSWNMFITPNKGDKDLRQNGATDPSKYAATDLGEYNGLDYMLMYNLYNIYNHKTNYYVNYDNNLALTNRTITGPEYYNARSFTDKTGYTGNTGAVYNGVLTASNITVNSGAYLNLRAGSSITISAPFTASGTMNATIYRPTDNAAWEMNICSDGMPANGGVPNGHREAQTTYAPRYLNLADYQKTQVENTASDNLGDSYPNPATSKTTIPYTLANETAIEIFIIDSNGSKVATLLKKESHAAGDFTIDYNTTSLSPGVYYYTLKTPAYSKTNKLVIIN